MSVYYIKNIVDEYLRVYPNERKDLELLLSQLDAEEVLNSRKNFRGHIAGSGLVFSPDFEEVLLIDHKAMDFWLQPGGHMGEDEALPRKTALREVIEETSVKIDKMIPLLDEQIDVPVDIDTHHNQNG